MSIPNSTTGGPQERRADLAGKRGREREDKERPPKKLALPSLTMPASDVDPSDNHIEEMDSSLNTFASVSRPLNKKAIIASWFSLFINRSDATDCLLTMSLSGFSSAKLDKFKWNSLRNAGEVKMFSKEQLAGLAVGARRAAAGDMRAATPRRACVAFAAVTGNLLQTSLKDLTPVIARKFGVARDLAYIGVEGIMGPTNATILLREYLLAASRHPALRITAQRMHRIAVSSGWISSSGLPDALRLPESILDVLDNRSRDSGPRAALSTIEDMPTTPTEVVTLAPPPAPMQQ